MSNFDFSTLNSSDLEDLFCDLLNAKEKFQGTKILFRTFKEGKDKGIDILYSTSVNEYEIVGQVKHYYRSGYNALILNLEKSEKTKVKKLKPGKYLFATSLDLSIANIQEVRNIFSPFIKDISDVYGKKDLNRLLEEYPEILDGHFKLWYSSTRILKRITSYEIQGRSNEFKENDLKRRLRIYVPTIALSEAKKILSNSHFIIITGEPGVGKTSTAEMLLYEYIRVGYQLVYIYDDIREIEKTLETPTDIKQIFYFDDFLGHNSVEIQKAKGSENILLKVLRRIASLPNKKMIFTTRSFILNTAIEESENLRRFNIKAKASIVNLKVYTPEIRRQILFNHVEESQLPEYLKEALRDESLRDFIVGHDNFSPRSIEFVTIPDHSTGMTVEEFKRFIRKNFNKPDEIWRHAYEQQINDIDRFLLNTMISFGDSVNIKELEEAFYSRLDYEVHVNNYQRPMDAFRRSIRRLENGFIVQETYDPDRYMFINPSLMDFLINFLKSNKDEVIRISESAVYLKQLITRMFPITENKHKDRISARLKMRLLNEDNFFIKRTNPNIDRLTLLIFIYRYFGMKSDESKIFSLFLAIDNWGFLQRNYALKRILVEFISTLENREFRIFIKEKGDNLFAELILSEDSVDEAVELIDLVKSKLGFDWKLLWDKDEDYGFSSHFSDLLNQQIEKDIEDLLGYSHAADYVSEKEDDILAKIEILEDEGLFVKANLSEYGKYDWWQIGLDNYMEEQMEKDD